MAERDRDRTQQQHYPQLQITPAHSRYDSGFSQKGPSTGQVAAIITLLPAAVILLGVAGITLVGSLIGVALATPLLVIFSPILVPAAIVTAGAVGGILTSQAFGVTGLAALSWVVNYFREVREDDDDDGKGSWMQEAREQFGEKARQIGDAVGEKTKQSGEAIKSKSQEGERTTPAPST